MPLLTKELSTKSHHGSGNEKLAAAILYWFLSSVGDGGWPPNWPQARYAEGVKGWPLCTLVLVLPTSFASQNVTSFLHAASS